MVTAAYSYLKAFTAKSSVSHLMIDGVERTLCGIHLDRIAHLETTVEGDEPGCMTCFRAMYTPDSARQDVDGTELALGDRVRPVNVEDGAPSWAEEGTVVGFGTLRTLVHWDGWDYRATLSSGRQARPHGVYAVNLRKITDQEGETHADGTGT